MDTVSIDKQAIGAALVEMGKSADKDPWRRQADAGAVGNVGRALKNILAGADGKLKEAQSAFTAVRTTHYSLTLPWVSNPTADRQRGPRLLATVLFDKYAEEMGKRKRAAEEALEAFLDDYPDAIVRAKTNLAALADAFYPTVDQVRSHFHVTYDFVPMPAGDDFQGLPSSTLDALGKFLEAKQQIMVDTARKSMIDEIRKRVGHLAERLASEGKRFQFTTVEAVRDLITLLPAWNLKGEAEIEDITRDIEWLMREVNAEGIRDSQDVRDFVQKGAENIISKLEELPLEPKPNPIAAQRAASTAPTRAGSSGARGWPWRHSWRPTHCPCCANP